MLVCRGWGRRRVARISVTRGHPWVPARLSSYLCTPSPFSPEIFSQLLVEMVLWWIFLEPKSNMTIYNLLRTLNFFPDLTGGIHPCPPLATPLQRCSSTSLYWRLRAEAMGCEQLSQGCFTAVSLSGFKPTTFRSQVRRPTAGHRITNRQRLLLMNIKGDVSYLLYQSEIISQQQSYVISIN